MSTVAFVLGAILVVVAELAIATAEYEESGASDKAALIENRLDRELHNWMRRSLAVPRTEHEQALADGETATAST